MFLHFLYLYWGSLFLNTLFFTFSCRFFNPVILSVNSNIVLSKGLFYCLIFSLSSVQFSRSVVSDSLRPHESQHSRLPCPSPSPRVHSDSCPSSQWCHPAISSSIVPFSCPQSLPTSESFPMSQLFNFFSTESHFPVCSCVYNFFGEGNGTPLQYSCLENPMDGGAW